MTNLERAAWASSDEWTQAYKLGFNKAIEVLKLYEQEDAIECLKYWAEHGYKEEE